MVFHIQGVEVGEMGDGVIGKAISAKLLGVCIEHDIIGSCWNEETVVGERTCRTEIEYKHEVAPHEGKDLVTVVVPDFLYGCLLEVALTLNDAEHLLVEIAQPVVA